jgi:hypothetical protein
MRGSHSYLKQKNDVERDFREQKLTTEENIKTRQEVQEVRTRVSRYVSVCVCVRACACAFVSVCARALR